MAPSPPEQLQLQHRPVSWGASPASAEISWKTSPTTSKSDTLQNGFSAPPKAEITAASPSNTLIMSPQSQTAQTVLMQVPVELEFSVCQAVA